MSFSSDMQKLCTIKHKRQIGIKQCTKIFLAFCLLGVSLISVACMDGGLGKKNQPLSHGQPNAQSISISSISWCDKPSMTFRDQRSNKASTSQSSTLGPATGTPTTVKDWNVVKANLGFTTYLPETLPGGTCLYNVTSSLRDPLFGSNFTITYMLANQDVLSFSQAPVIGKNTSFQCSVSQSVQKEKPKAASPDNQSRKALQMCSGVKEKTSIVFSARDDVNMLQQLFDGLKADINWMPAS